MCVCGLAAVCVQFLLSLTVMLASFCVFMGFLSCVCVLCVCMAMCRSVVTTWPSCCKALCEEIRAKVSVNVTDTVFVALQLV